MTFLFQLAKSIYNNGDGTALTNVREFCSPTEGDTNHCATLYKMESLICVSLNYTVNRNDN